jgi:plastocyanin
MRLRFFLVVAALCACSCGDKKKPGKAQVESRPKPTKVVDAATTGTVEGVVGFVGTPRPNTEIGLSDPACKKGLASPILRDEALVQDGKLQNAFVYLKSGLEEYAFEPPQAEVSLDQRNCVYRPLVVGVQVGQALTFVNSDPVLHNVHTVPDENDGTNIAMPSLRMRHTVRFDTEEVPVKTKCDVHPWMRAYIGVVEHPFFAVTGPDGRFRFPGVPPGTYVVEAWHEVYGRKTQQVTLGANESKTIEFGFASN